MPESPEVKLFTDLIKPLVHGKQIIGLETYATSRYATLDPEGFKDFVKSLSPINNPVQIVDVSCKGKFMYWTFSNDFYLMCTFGMSGQWSPIKGKHPCISIKYRDNDEDKIVYFNDPRHFGTIKFVNNYLELKIKLDELGWDALGVGFDERWINYLFNSISCSNKPIAQLLMDQSLFCGVGNYIKAESLYDAKISPWRKGKDLSLDEFYTLCKSIVDVMQTSYNYQGATILTYKNAYGAEGKYSNFFKVYGKKTDLLGNVVIKEETPDKRTTHWCPSVQK